MTQGCIERVTGEGVWSMLGGALRLLKAVVREAGQAHAAELARSVVCGTTHMYEGVWHQPALGCATGSRLLLGHITLSPTPCPHTPHPALRSRAPAKQTSCANIVSWQQPTRGRHTTKVWGGATVYFVNPRPSWSCVRKASEERSDQHCAGGVGSCGACIAAGA